jgi:two-component sensor histidine kinase
MQPAPLGVPAQPAARLSVRLILCLFAAASLVPIVVLAAAALHTVQRTERQRAQERALTAAGEAASAVARELKGMLGALEVLATSEHATLATLEAFHTQSSKVAGLLGSNIILFDPLAGTQLVNTRLPYGTELPGGVDQWALRAAERRSPQVSGIVIGQVTRRPLFGFYVPVIRDGRTIAVLASAYEPSRLARVLEETVRVPGWIVSVVDRDGLMIARSVQHDAFVGQPAPAGPWRRALAGEKLIWDALNLDGEAVLMASAISDIAGWMIAVLVPRRRLDDPLWRQWVLFVLGSLIAISASLALAIIFARQVTRPILDLAEQAHRLGRGELLERGSSACLKEAETVASALREAARQRREHEDRIELLVREVNHRSKNVLAVVQAIARQTARVSPEHFLSSFTSRLGALAASHDLLVESEWRGVDLGSLVMAELGRFHELIGSRIMVQGPPVRLSPHATQTIGMALHELATNAAKYGALSSDVGRVEIEWRLSHQLFAMTWSENGGPAVSPPARRGFGTTLIRDMPAKSLKADVELKYERTGVLWSLAAPAQAVIDGVPAVHAEGSRSVH